MQLLTSPELAAAVACRDLTDPGTGPHAIQMLIDKLESALAQAWAVPVRRDPGPRVVPVADNYDRLGYTTRAVTRDSRYTRYVTADSMLRSHTTARIPHLLHTVDTETVLSVPGMVYRRDSIDRLHTGMPHQHDLWRIRPAGPPLGEADLDELIELAVTAVLPGRTWRTIPAIHPYTVAGREIYVRDGRAEVEIGECGLADPALLAREGLADASGLAVGLGLDRLLMIAKGIPDIRLLRAADPRIAGQMTGLQPYRPISAMPSTVRDLSLVMDGGVDGELAGDLVRDILGDDADTVEHAQIIAATSYSSLPPAARERMGMSEGQVNMVLRLVLSHPSRTLTTLEGNRIRDRVYAGLHQGTRHEWATPAV